MVRVRYVQARIDEIAGIDRFDRHGRGFARRLCVQRLLARLAPSLQTPPLPSPSAADGRAQPRAARGIFLFDAVKRAQNDLRGPEFYGRRSARQRRPTMSSVRSMKLPPGHAALCQSGSTRRQASGLRCESIRTPAPRARTLQPARQRKWKYVAREFRQLAAAVLEQALVRRCPGMTGFIRTRDDFLWRPNTRTGADFLWCQRYHVIAQAFERRHRLLHPVMTSTCRIASSTEQCCSLRTCRTNSARPWMADRKYGSIGRPAAGLRSKRPHRKSATALRSRSLISAVYSLAISRSAIAAFGGIGFRDLTALPTGALDPGVGRFHLRPRNGTTVSPLAAGLAQ